jgi:DNA polymerase I
MTDRKTFFLLDGAHAMYRSYHAIRGLSTSRGFPTNAVFGFVQIVQKVLKDHTPDYFLVVFDTPAPTFRHKLFPAYKANRPPMPEELSVQIPWIRKVLDAYRIPQVQLEGYEGDDLMGTYACLARGKNMDAVLVTGDKDLCQIAGDRIRILDPRRDLLIGPEEVVSLFGVTPEQIPDLLALTGDTVDNLPGIPGVGMKTAAVLLQRFGSLEELFRRTAEIEKPALRKKVEEHRETVIQTRELVEICCRVPVEENLEAFRKQDPDPAALRGLFLELEFQRLLEALPAEKNLPSDRYRTVFDDPGLEELVRALAGAREGFALDLETTSLVAMQARPVGLSFAVNGDRAWYIPVGHHYLGAPAQLPLNRVLERLRPILEDPALPKFGQNIKYDLLVLKTQGAAVRGVSFDTMIASYLIDSSRRGHGLDDLSMEYLHHRKISYTDVTGPRGASQRTFDEVEVQTGSVYACEDAHATYQLTRILEKKIREEGFEKLFHEVEVPLIEVLTEMEFTGIRVDVAFLGTLTREFHEKLQRLEKEIHDIAGCPFNINSTQQLGKILFEDLGLPMSKKTKTGYATDVTVLTNLADRHPLPRLVLDYRSLAKLLSTYVEALPRLVHPSTGRIHTSFNQSVTATGRLSSSDPNLQNIPIRTPEGRKIRRAFVPEEGMCLLSADYSQIELRILAHVSGDTRLREAFHADEDVHAHTAGSLFGCAPGEVTDEMRRKAKVINFGVIYGMGAYGLAGQLGISRGEAAAFIDHYFQTYSGVKAWQEACLVEARKTGYVTTLLNRKRPLPEISSGNGSVRSMAERTAINTPIQGTAADMIKVAMVRVFHRLREEGFRTRMLLQVHDELVFEVPETERERVTPILRQEMEGVMPLDVPMKVDVQHGRNWSEAH